MPHLTVHDLTPAHYEQIRELVPEWDKHGIQYALEVMQWFIDNKL